MGAGKSLEQSNCLIKAVFSYFILFLIFNFLSVFSNRRSDLSFKILALQTEMLIKLKMKKLVLKM